MALSTGKGQSSSIAGCAEANCDVSTLTCTTWHRCRHCLAPHSPVSSLRFFHLSEGEASYCSAAIRCNAVSLLRHNLFLCSQCQVAEFPGTKDGGLTLNIEGYLYDVPTHHFLKPDAYHFTHLHKCTGSVSLLSVRLSREEAIHLGRLIRKTPTIEAGKGAEVEPFALHHHRSPAPLSATTASFAASSASSAPSVRLSSPWGYSSWQVSPTGRAAVLAELLMVVRVLLSAGRRPSTILKDDSASSALTSSHSVQSSPSHSRATSISNSPRPERRAGERVAPSIRAQWREALYSKLRSSLLLTPAVCELLSRDSSSALSTASTSSYLTSLLSLLLLGGHVPELYPGCPISFRIDSQDLRGRVRRFDPSLATVSVSLTRGSSAAAPDSAPHSSSSNSSSSFSSSTDWVELAVDEVKAESEVAPPSLSSLELLTDVVHVGQRLLTAKVEGAVNQLLLGRLQWALLQLMQAQLPSLSSSSSSSLTGTAPLSSLIAPLLSFTRPSLSLYPLHPSHPLQSTVATRVELELRLPALLQSSPASSSASHSAFLASVRPPRTEESTAQSTLQSHPPSSSRSSSISSHSSLILPRPESPAEAPVMPIILMHLAQLTEMGFSSIAARFALAQYRGDVNMATNAILTEHIYEDGDIDEHAAMERWDHLLDRLNVRAEVDAWNAWTANQQQGGGGTSAGGGGAAAAGAASASADIKDSHSTAAALSAGGRGGGGEKTSAVSSALQESEAERERKLLTAASSVYLAHRFLWPTEEPEQPDPSCLPLSSPSVHSTPLTSSPLPYHADPAFSLQHLLHALLSNSLLHSRVLITEDAASVYNKPTPHTRKGYKVGDKLHIVDLVNKVCPAEVVEVNASGSKIYIHYSGWSKKCTHSTTHTPPHTALTTPLHSTICYSHQRLIHCPPCAVLCRVRSLLYHHTRPSSASPLVPSVSVLSRTVVQCSASAWATCGSPNRIDRIDADGRRALFPPRRRAGAPLTCPFAAVLLWLVV